MHLSPQGSLEAVKYYRAHRLTRLHEGSGDLHLQQDAVGSRVGLEGEHDVGLERGVPRLLKLWASCSSKLLFIFRIFPVPVHGQVDGHTHTEVTVSLLVAPQHQLCLQACGHQHGAWDGHEAPGQAEHVTIPEVAG